MADLIALKEWFLGRQEAFAAEEKPPEPDERTRLLGLADSAFPVYHALKGDPAAYRSVIEAQTENVLSGFLRPVGSVFYRRLDHETALAVLVWIHELYRFCEMTGEWRLARTRYELLNEIFGFFVNPRSPYLSSSPDGIISCRMQKEYGFLPENAVLNTLPLNILWYQSLNIMNQLGQRFADIKTASVSERLLLRFQEAFQRGFWDAKAGTLRFAWHPDSDFTVVSGWGLFAFHFLFDDLLYKQKKKRFLREIWEVYYDDRGIKATARDNHTLVPELLPVYWRAYLKFHAFAEPKKREILRLLDRHVESARPMDFLKYDRPYCRRMIEFLAEIRSPGDRD